MMEDEQNSTDYSGDEDGAALSSEESNDLLDDEASEVSEHG